MRLVVCHCTWEHLLPTNKALSLSVVLKSQTDLPLTSWVTLDSLFKVSFLNVLVWDCCKY